jgi:DDE superfamily endonuclease/Tc5 transposase DNA-binding domain/CENP-B N-terminal DNA-binding domain
MAERRVCKTLTLAQRVEVLKRLDNKHSQSSVALEFGVNQSQISRIQKNKDKIFEEWQNNTNPDRKRKRTGKAEAVEEALLRWFAQARSRQIPVSGPLLMEKADQLAHGLGLMDFKATSGWLERWKTRNAIHFKRQHGEKQDADDFGAERWVVEVLPGILKDYSPRDIFNADETGLYWRALPDGTLSFNGSEAPGAKTAKDRMTALLACNMDGSEKLPALVIGKSKNPRCFKNIKKLPVDYEANKNAWMTSIIWNDWLKRLDNKMRTKKRKIIMLCDNCAAHDDSVKLTNVKVVFLPPNTTSLIQPMDQGIIANFKKQYRALILRRLVNEIDSGSNSENRAAMLAKKLTVLDALHMLSDAWNKTTQQTIANCYKKASFVATSADELNAERETERENEMCMLSGMTVDDFNRYVAVDYGLPTEAEISDSSIIISQQQNSDQQDGDQESSDEDDVATAPVSFAEAAQSLQVIRAFMEQRGCQSYEPLYEIEAVVHGLNRQTVTQKSITDFFKSA